MRFWYFVVFWDLSNMNGTMWFCFLTFSSLLLKSHFNKIIICKSIYLAAIVHTYIKLIYYVFHVICILQPDPLSRNDVDWLTHRHEMAHSSNFSIGFLLFLYWSFQNINHDMNMSYGVYCRVFSSHTMYVKGVPYSYKK